MFLECLLDAVDCLGGTTVAFRLRLVQLEFFVRVGLCPSHVIVIFEERLRKLSLGLDRQAPDLLVAGLGDMEWGLHFALVDLTVGLRRCLDALPAHLYLVVNEGGQGRRQIVLSQEGVGQYHVIIVLVQENAVGACLIDLDLDDCWLGREVPMSAPRLPVRLSPGRGERVGGVRWGVVMADCML